MCWLYFLIVFVLFLLASAWYLGVFYKVDIRIGKPPIVGPFTVAYKFSRGPYKNVGPFFQEAMKLCPNGKSFGIYYDDPDVVPETNLRWAVGLITEDNGNPFIDPHILPLLQSRKFKFATFPAIEKAIVTQFPMKFCLSILIAIKKVYPALKVYQEKTSVYGQPAFEFYGLEPNMIHYAFVLQNNEQYVVEEAH